MMVMFSGSIPYKVGELIEQPPIPRTFFGRWLESRGWVAPRAPKRYRVVDTTPLGYMGMCDDGRS